ncbi:hypothetical protein [Cytobacillus firmus]|uniref:hypothetical protein n=1 Tax=Cytobacillus firmus TaxID=1399 RepID=UPI0018CCE935|nr:hypothetical protein [Cytobacillus firmus]
MYDEMYVMEALMKTKQKEMDLITPHHNSSNNKLICRLPVIKNLDACQCQE